MEWGSGAWHWTARPSSVGVQGSWVLLGLLRDIITVPVLSCPGLGFPPAPQVLFPPAPEQCPTYQIPIIWKQLLILQSC